MIHCFMLSEADYQQKIEHNKKPIIDKDFIDLSETELRQFVSDARTKYFYYKKDGVNVACGKEQDNKNGKFDTELFACRKLAECGHEVFLLPENYAMDGRGNKKVHSDTITDGRTLELKHTQKNIQDNYRKAKHQATDVFIHIKGIITKDDALSQIRSSVRAMKKDNKAHIDFAGKVYLYFEKDNKLWAFDFDSKGNYALISPTKNSPP